MPHHRLPLLTVVEHGQGLHDHGSPVVEVIACSLGDELVGEGVRTRTPTPLPGGGGLASPVCAISS